MLLVLNDILHFGTIKGDSATSIFAAHRILDSLLVHQVIIKPNLFLHSEIIDNVKTGLIDTLTTISKNLSTVCYLTFQVIITYTV